MKDIIRTTWNAGRVNAKQHPRIWLACASALVLLSFLLATYAHGPGKSVRVIKGDLASKVQVTGTLKAINTDILGPPSLPHIWDYSIARMAPEGTEVKKGKVVLAFDVSDLAKELKEKTTESSEAAKQIEKKNAELRIQKEDNRLKLAEAEANLRKIEMLLDVPPDLKSANNLQKTKLDLRSAKAEVASLK